MEATDINWEPILELLPTIGSEEYEERVKEMFDLLNVNEAKGLTIYEIENGIVDMTQTGDLFDSEKAINDAFKYASKFKYEKTKDMEEKLDFKQMKLFIRILRMTYCFYQAFNYIDSDGEHVISKETFTKESTKEVLDYWLGPSEDWEEDFDNIDLTNKKGEGNVLFREFFDWAIHKNIDHQGDMGVNLE